MSDDLFTLAAACAHDPLRWSAVAWDWGQGPLAQIDGPRGWQAEILTAIRDHLADPATRFQPLQIAVSSGHGIGKSALMGMISNWALSCHVGARILTTANTEAQLRTKTGPEIRRWFTLSLTAPWFDLQATAIKARDPAHAEGWRQDFVSWSATNTEAFAGLHNQGRLVMLLFDEASNIDDKVWEVAEGALTDANTILIWVVFGNPTRNSGRFRECFRRYRHRWLTRQIDSRSVPGTNLAKIEQWRQDHGEDSDFFKVRVRGEFPSQSTRQFIAGSDVEAARSRVLRPGQYNFAPVILGIDPAWTGEDAFVIALRQGLHARILASFPHNDDDVAMANLIARLQEQHRADAVFIDAGFGTGIVSAGKALGQNWRLVWFSGQSPDPGCLNLRAFLWREMRDWLKQGGALDPADQELAQDLIGPETVPRLDGKIQLEGKQAMKSRGLPSPNRADALALTFTAPVSRGPVAAPTFAADSPV